MKTAQEWIQEFDLLYNGINSNIAPALDDYEKSVFLTMAQEEIVKTLYSGGATGLEGFESSEQLRRALNVLLQSYESEIFDDVTDNMVTLVLPKDVLYIVYETINSNNKYKIVTPVTHDNLYKTQQNPFKGPTNTRTLRMDIGTTLVNENQEQVVKQTIQLIGVQNGDKYVMKYIRRPQPIILTDLTGTYDYINGKQALSLCELDESLHRVILQSAVQLAITTQTR